MISHSPNKRSIGTLRTVLESITPRIRVGFYFAMLLCVYMCFHRSPRIFKECEERVGSVGIPVFLPVRACKRLGRLMRLQSLRVGSMDRLRAARVEGHSNCGALRGSAEQGGRVCERAAQAAGNGVDGVAAGRAIAGADCGRGARGLSV